MPRLLSRSLAGLLLLLSWTLGTAAELPDFTKLAKQLGPAVVNIKTVQNHGVRGRMHGFNIPDLPDDSPLNEFFRRFLDEEGGGRPDDKHPARSLGSGFFISPDGYILTNRHVVEGADEVIVSTNDRREFPAKLVGADKRADIALLKIDADNLPIVPIGTTKDLEVGAWVLAIGSPFGYDHSVTAGIVSAKGRSLPDENYVPFIQTDVAINPGNSGGPLIDLDGKVVGINAQIYSRTGGFMGLSFAIPIEMAMDVVEQLKSKGRVSRGWLGVLIQDVNRDLAEIFHMPQPKGALVARILPNGPAEKSGLQVGDIILAFNGTDVATSAALPPLVGASPVDAASTLRVLRDGKEMEIKVTVGELPDDNRAATLNHPDAATGAADRLGLVARDLDEAQRRDLGAGGNRGVLVDKVQDGAAQSAGIRPGDLILMMNNESVKNLAHYRTLVQGLPAGKSVAVLVQREENRQFIALRVPK